MGFETEKDYSRILDPTGRRKQALAYLPYEQNLAKQKKARADAIAAGKATAAGIGFVGKINRRALQDQYLDRLTMGDKKMFQISEPKNMFDRVGRNLFGGSKRDFELTPSAVGEGYKIVDEGGKEVAKHFPGLVEGAPLGDELSKTKDIQSLLANAKTSFSKKPDALDWLSSKGMKPETIKGLSKGIGTIGGLANVGLGIKAMTDPDASASQQFAGGVSAFMGVNSLLTQLGMGLINPAGFIPLAVSLGSGYLASRR